jgi:hypothetical protein
MDPFNIKEILDKAEKSDKESIRRKILSESKKYFNLSEKAYKSMSAKGNMASVFFSLARSSADKIISLNNFL